MTNLFQQLSDEMALISSGVQHSLVQVTDGRGSIGSGTIWHSDGLIVTNAHVVLEQQIARTMGGYRVLGTRPRELNVILSDGREFPAQLIATDEQNDLAALAVDATDLPVIEPGDSKALRPGQWVMALGHPWGVVGALTAGVVISVGNDLPEVQTGREWIALNLQLRPGHSGGPLVDTDGRLVGVNTMITGPEVGFAIPSHTVKAFLKETLGKGAPVV